MCCKHTRLGSQLNAISLPSYSGGPVYMINRGWLEFKVSWSPDDFVLNSPLEVELMQNLMDHGTSSIASHVELM